MTTFVAICSSSIHMAWVERAFVWMMHSDERLGALGILDGLCDLQLLL